MALMMTYALWIHFMDIYNASVMPPKMNLVGIDGHLVGIYVP